MSDSHERWVSAATLIDTASGEEKIIPPEHPYRTLVLCFDGTGDQFDSDAGIGTYTTPEIATPFRARMAKAVDEAVAWNLDAHVMGGYEFLMQNYTAGDRICIFGFSRGAYTARSLAGMIHKVGILPASNKQQVPFAYKMYTRADEVGWQQSNAFKKAFSIDADIDFIGVWDTVNSVGLIPRRLPFTMSNTNVRTFRHAVSLDERRAKFKANLWNRPDEGEAKLGLVQKGNTPGLGSAIENHPLRQQPHSMWELEQKYSKDRSLPTDVEEVWFAGCHCDIGGGSVSNDTKPNLARIPLRWMIRECFKTNTGIMFYADMLEEIMGVDPAVLYPTVLPRPPALKVSEEQGHYIRSISDDAAKSKTSTESLDEGTVTTTGQRPTEEELELMDALSPIYDQLSLNWFWWILEFFPIRIRYQSGGNSRVSYLGWNLGRGRHIPKQETEGVKVHRSVKLRMEARYKNGQRYVPKASFDERCTTWVD
ncbi:hypothetical protein E1B28_009509 [Marasmius oreades]|uniref:T6SS Phospholipase effector Tle1-like catalytic domain-containing protein n=1 Tax=Marasmius oreades TaxID=181124 RepID=A0A9P7RVF4_9AGAR|nr:uncharacterized protein E1B28_009509 [Marasmius oreades]KAG7090390.1 hypothetical protein E1B28_009509 [Marasmius oreades]